MEILLLLIAHFLGDFVFQSSRIAHKKMYNIKYFFLHCAIYSGIFLLPLLCFGPTVNIALIFIAITITHALIDYGRIKILKKMRKNKADYKSKDFAIFITDQVFHIMVIVVCSNFIYDYSIIGDAAKNILAKHLKWKQLYNILVYILMYIICLSPTAVFIKKVFVFFSIQDDTYIYRKEELISSGYLIGILERIIILTLGLNAQLGAIGFVLAAKSLARFKQLEDKSFAEKYLLGTLLSVAISLFCVTIGNFLLIKM